MNHLIEQDFNLMLLPVLDEIGHGVRMGGTPRQRPQRGSSQGSIQSVGGMSGNSAMMVGPAPTTKPPTPPQVTRTGSKVSVSGGTLSKGYYHFCLIL